LTRRSLLFALSGRDLRRQWIEILGKLEPTAKDRRWFLSKMTEREVGVQDRGSYLRNHIELPLEVDFYQPALLLVPKGLKRGEKRPTVIAWASTAPDWQKPEEWWGKWLVEQGFIVLTSWAHIRRYRDNTSFVNGVSEKVYERFGRWAGLSRMVWDVRQQARFLASHPNVDRKRMGFIGSSLSAKTALYVAAFAPEIHAVTSIDPHVPLWDGGTNYEAPWYLDADRKFADIRTPEQTVRSLLKGHDHDEILTLAAPKPLLIVGGNDRKHSDGPSTLPLIEKASIRYRELGVPDRLKFHLLDTGHTPVHPKIDPLWQAFFTHFLRGNGLKSR
jgi:hypothetical protein